MKVVLTPGRPASSGRYAHNRPPGARGTGTGNGNINVTQLIGACAVLIIFISITASRSDGGRFEQKRPLYKDESGWMVWSCLPGSEVTDRYSWLLDRFRNDGVTLPDDFAPAFDYMLWHSPERFYSFVLVIPDGITTYWGPRSALTMRYVYEDEAHEITSTEFLITDTHQKIVIHSYEIEGLAPIPTGAYDIYSTPNDNPIIFVKFPLRHEPEKVLSVTVHNVKTQ